MAIWYPFATSESESFLKINKASGAYLYDDSGNRYFDAVCSWWVSAHGHCHPTIAQAIAKQAAQMDQILFGDFTHDLAENLTSGLLDILPFNQDASLFFSDNGSTSVEVAIKIADQYFEIQGNDKRSKCLSLKGSYHGDTYGAMALGRSSQFFQPFVKKFFDVIPVSVPLETIEGCENVENHVESFKTLLYQNKGEIAYIVIEPLVLGASGMKLYSKTFLNEILKLCKQEGILIIADEVFTGFGRLGTLFASEQLDTKPDIMCLSKIITGGALPLGATVISREIAKVFSEKYFPHGHSYTANPIACAAALANLEIFKKERTLDKIAFIADTLKNQIKTLSDCKTLSNLRHLGVIAAFDVNNNATYSDGFSKRITKTFLSKGIFLRPLGNTIYCVLPYCAETDEIHYLFQSIRQEFS